MPLISLNIQICPARSRFVLFPRSKGALEIGRGMGLKRDDEERETLHPAISHFHFGRERRDGSRRLATSEGARTRAPLNLTILAREVHGEKKAIPSSSGLIVLAEFSRVVLAVRPAGIRCHPTIAVRLNGVIRRLRRRWRGPPTEGSATWIDRSPEKMKKGSKA